MRKIFIALFIGVFLFLGIGGSSVYAVCSSTLLSLPVDKQGAAYKTCASDAKNFLCGRDPETNFDFCCSAASECPAGTPGSNKTGGISVSEKLATDITCKNNTGINTAIGCIPINDTNELISFILRWALGLAGGIAFLLILWAGFQIMTSRGDPQRLKAGQELLTSAIAGLLLLIFSIFILRVIGVNILNIQGFGQ